MKKNLKVQLKQTAIYAHGSAKTRAARVVKVGNLATYLKKHNIQINHIEQIKAKYIEDYIQERKTQGINLRTLQNDMAAIRQTLRAAGRDKLANSERISNKTLGLAGASRAGNKIAIPDNQYHQIQQKAFALNPALAATIEIARTFGLRGEEAVQSCQSLKTWKAVIEKGENKIKVVFGTKGGRSRETIILDKHRALNAVNTALQITENQNGKLINTANLKQAMTYWHNHCDAIGLKGLISPHSLRYAFAQDVMTHYLAQGHTKKEALALTSMDLGHGDGRGRYVEKVYSLKGGQ